MCGRTQRPVTCPDGLEFEERLRPVMTDRSTKSYLYEGAVIVASILVAFGLDASSASYQDSIIER